MRIHIIDAFTDRPFRGNPAGVCLLEPGDWPDEAWMRQVAAELNFSETAFALPAADGDWSIRWFAPLVEMNLCGHATLATTHALRKVKGIEGTVRFHSRRSGVLVAHTGEDGSITLDFPAAHGAEATAPDGLAEALGAKPEAVRSTGTLGDLLTVFPDEGAVRAVAPDHEALAELTRREGLRGVIITAPAPDGASYDFVSRFFAPADGVLEDPVTGSAHTALAPYWAQRLGRDGLTGLQASARSGLVRTRVQGERVLLTGQAVTIVDGDLRV